MARRATPSAPTWQTLAMSPPPRLGPPAEALTQRSRVLLNDLESLIVSEGFAHLTLTDLTHRLRCSRRAFYDIAPTRLDLLLITIDRRLRRLGRVAREQLEGVDDPMERLHRLLTAEATTLQATSAQFRYDAESTPTMRQLLLTHRRYGVWMIHNVLVDGMERGRFRRMDPILVTEFLDAAAIRLDQPQFADHDGSAWSDHALELSRFVEAAVLLPEH